MTLVEIIIFKSIFLTDTFSARELAIAERTSFLTSSNPKPLLRDEVIFRADEKMHQVSSVLIFFCNKHRNEE